MFKDTLLKALKTLSPQEKDEVRDILIEKISDTTEKENQEGEQSMDKEKERVDASITVDEKKEIKDDTKVEEGKKEAEETKNTEETVKTEEKTDKTDGNDDDKTAEQNVVQEVQETGNAIRIEDLVTKDELAERLASFEAKYSAVIKENEDLKNKLSDMENKYENKDFGNMQRKGVQKSDKDANSDFEEYSKQFM